jgi:hypothetical protein
MEGDGIGLVGWLPSSLFKRSVQLDCLVGQIK